MYQLTKSSPQSNEADTVMITISALQIRKPRCRESQSRITGSAKWQSTLLRKSGPESMLWTTRLLSPCDTWPQGQVLAVAFSASNSRPGVMLGIPWSQAFPQGGVLPSLCPGQPERKKATYKGTVPSELSSPRAEARMNSLRLAAPSDNPVLRMSPESLSPPGHKPQSSSSFLFLPQRQGRLGPLQCLPCLSEPLSSFHHH